MSHTMCAGLAAQAHVGGVARNFYLVQIIFLAKLGCYTVLNTYTIQPSKL
jgi:uncharacterized membrane protein